MKLKSHALWLMAAVGVVVADNSTSAPEFAVAPVATPPIKYCASDNDCKIFSDVDAICVDNGCQCNYQKFLHIDKLAICIYLGNANQYIDVHFVTRFTKGDCPTAKLDDSSVVSDYTTVMTNYLNGMVDGYIIDYTQKFMLCGSVYMVGTATLQALNALDIINSMSTGLESEFLRGSTKYANTISVLNPSSNIVVQVSFGGLECSSDNARSTIYINTYCCALECYPGYKLTQVDDYITRCDREDSDMSRAELAAIILGAVWGCLILLALLWCCCIKEDKQPEVVENKNLNKSTSDIDEAQVTSVAPTEPLYDEPVVNDPFVNEPFDEPAPAPQPQPEPEPEPEPAPEPEPEPEPAPEPEPEPEPVPEPVPEPEPEPEVDRDASARVIQKAMRRFINRVRYLRALRIWKDQEAARKQRIAEGRAGSMNMGVNAAMKVEGVTAGGAAANAGIMVGDIVVLVRTTGRGGKKILSPTPNRFKFSESVGPQNEVFEGTHVEVVVVRDPAQQKKWLEKNLEPPSPDDQAEHDAWIRGVEDVETIILPVVIGAESDKVRDNRLKKMKEMKELYKIEKMDAQLVIDFMSYPDKCKEFTRKVYAKADNDGSGVLELKEMEKVFEQMAECTGCKPPSEDEMKQLFYIMDESHDGEVSFEEFFPTFRSYQMKAIAKLVAYDEDKRSKK